MAISLDKVASEAPGLLSLAKSVQDALTARGLAGHSAKVALALDYSGSMREQYRSGAMQRLVEKVLALGTQFDDDGAIDVFFFDSEARYSGEVTLGNYDGVVERMTAGRHMGTTNYADTFRMIEKHYGFAGGNVAKSGGLRKLFSKAPISSQPAPAALDAPVNEPVYVVFLTDGAPNNRTEAVKAIIEVSYSPIFWQFLSIGRESIQFLEKLDDLGGRYIDNADYKPAGDVDKLTDDALWGMLLDEYPEWVAEERRRGQIR